MPICFGVPNPRTYGAPLAEIPFSAEPSIAMHSSIASTSANSGPRIRSVLPAASSSSPPTYETTNTYRTITAPA